MINVDEARAYAREHWPSPVVRRPLEDVFDNCTRVDAEPVRHGRWKFEFELDETNFYRCSECDRQEVLLAKENIEEWCPYCHCGAKMDGGVEGA